MPVATDSTDGSDAEDVKARIKEVIVDALQVDPEKITPDAKFGDDLNADSLDLVELTMALEEEFDIQVEETELEGIETVGHVWELVFRKLKEKQEGEAA